MTISTDQHERRRELALQAIERTLEEMAQQRQLHVKRCNWIIDPKHTSAAPHRLELRIAGRTEKIYFTERELTQCDNGSVGQATATRLHHVLDRISEERMPLPLVSSLKDLIDHVRP